MMAHQFDRLRCCVVSVCLHSTGALDCITEDSCSHTLLCCLCRSKSKKSGGGDEDAGDDEDEE